jgi:hypothetical protein
MIRHSHSCIARMTPAGARLPSGSRGMRRGGLQPISPSYRICSAPSQSRTRMRLFTGNSEVGQRMRMRNNLCQPEVVASAFLAQVEQKPMKCLSQYFVALALVFGGMAINSLDVHAATGCGPNGCRHVYTHRYTHRGQWPVGGAYHPHRRTQASNPPANDCPFCASTFRH